MDQVCSRAGVSIRDAMGGSGGEETEAGDQQRTPGIRPSCARTRLRKDEDLASLCQGYEGLAEALGKLGVYSEDTCREKPTGGKDSVHPNGTDARISTTEYGGSLVGRADRH